MNQKGKGKKREGREIMGREVGFTSSGIYAVELVNVIALTT